MELYYAKSKNGNFGDDMNLWFWDHFLPDWRTQDPDRTLFGIGTILGTNILNKHGKVLVCGSGSGYGSLAPVDPDRVRISWVRGKLTADRLGLDHDIAISDPAYLVTTLPEFSNLPRGGKGTIFIPHRSTAQLQINWDRIGQLCNLQVVLPNQDSKEVIKRIISADLVVTESMHGAIFADAFRIPWVPIKISNQFNDFKWNDWALGVGVTVDSLESLALPKKIWRLINSVKSRLKGRHESKSHQSASAEGALPQETVKKLEASSFDLGEDGRMKVKRMLAFFSPVIEKTLAADIRRAMRHHTHLSAEEETKRVIYKMAERLEIESGLITNR